MSNIQIRNCHSYTKAEMRKKLNDKREHSSTPTEEKEVLDHRSNFSLINEWCVHSLLYRLGIARERTKDCDLNWPQKWYIRTAYTVAGLIARIFTR